jgi:cold shock CspA family protein
MKLYGTVKKFLEPGYGFIVSDEIERDVYFHARDWRSADDPLPGQRVMFELIPAWIEGKPEQATNVHPIRAKATATYVLAGIGALAVGLKGGE